MSDSLKILFFVALSALLFAVIEWPISVQKEQKLYTAAVLRVMQSYPPSIELHRRSLGGGQSVVTYGRPSGAIPYKNVSEFNTANPDCCALVDRAAEGWQPSFLNKLFGFHSYIVRVRYGIRHIGADGAVHTIPHETFIILKRSGKVTHA